jgi:bifunctional non-homologous end joining protein LigD
VAGGRISVSNLDKVLYPGKKFTKADVINYYVRVSKYLLPHLRNRPVTLKRFPDEVFGEFFYEKDAPVFTPKWVKTVSVPRRETPGADIRYIVINDLPTLVWLANLANLEIHPFLHRVPRIDRPTAIVFDCDPGEGANILHCGRVALMLRDVLHELGLDSYVKVSGSKGLQVYVPLNSAITYDETQALAKALAELLAQRETRTETCRCRNAKAIENEEGFHRLEPKCRAQNYCRRVFPSRKDSPTLRVASSAVGRTRRGNKSQGCRGVVLHTRTSN